MKQTRLKKSSSPGRFNPLGLLCLVILAAIVGAMLGSCAARRSLPNRVAAGPHAAQTAEDPESSRAPRAGPTSETGGAQAHRAAGDDGAESGPGAGGETAQATAPDQPRVPRRPVGYSGEIAFAKNCPNKVALTFDAGASSAATPALLDTLKSRRLHVTFFLTGKWCERNPDLVRRIHDDGHEIGNHTYSHKDLRKLTDEEICRELNETNDIIVRLIGQNTAPYFRPPYGGRDRRVLRVAAEAGYTSVYWSLDSWDAFKTGITNTEVRSRVLDRIQGGDIVLMHCGSQATASALPDLIAELDARGYHIVTISDLINSGRP